MPLHSGTIPVDERGTVLYYEDTGAPVPPNSGPGDAHPDPGDSDYLTVVLIHGSLFHSGASLHPLSISSSTSTSPVK